VAFKITVDSFGEKTPIPAEFTCEGKDISPALHWTGEPSQTRSFALIMDDPDAPGRTWNHWLAWDIPADLHSLPEAIEDAALGKFGGKSGTNDFGQRGYGGPCPPQRGGWHRYFFRLFALDTSTLGVPEGAKRAALEKAVKKHVLAEAAYMGRFQRT